MEVNELTKRIIGCAIEVHKALGPGLLESAYEECLCHELALQRIPFERQVELPVEYKGVRLNAGFRVDLLVDGVVIVEVKAVETLLAVHDAQVITYLRLGHWQIGLLINFNVTKLSNGVHRLVLGLKE